MSDTWTFTGDAPITCTRDTHGVIHVTAETERDLYRGVGHAHGTDRSLQMLMVRILAAGRGSELLDASAEMLGLDRFFRRMHFGRCARTEVAKITPADRALAEAYCDGVNRALAAGLPWELRALGVPWEPWTVADCIVLSRVIGYVALAQSQGDMERLFVEMVQAGVPRPHLDALFPGVLDGFDPAVLDGVKLGERLVPLSFRWSAAVPRAVASNNWAIAPARTATGTAIFANDPHLECNRLPSVWYELVARLGERWCITATMPGVPSFLLGRTPDVAWGATYTFMDGIDSWVEECRDGRARRVVDGVEQWVPFRERTEVVQRKGLAPVTFTFWENDHGVLDGDPRTPGRYLATRWASGSDTGAASLSASLRMLHAPDVAAGMAALGTLETAWNWVLADRHGNIGYQMSGEMPRRREGWSGFTPVAGWDPANDWQGFHAPEELPRCLNPPEGFIATANQDLNHLGRTRPINLPMGPYRAERIASLLGARSDWTAADVERMHMDVWSSQAERFLAVLRPLLPATPQGDVLRTWDLRYDLESEGAYLFELFYHALLIEVFGAVCGTGVLAYLAGETSIVADFYWNFDRVLLDAESVWYADEGREAVWRRVAAAALATPVRTWGSVQQMTMRHLLFGDRLPGMLGFDYGPVGLRGGRATIHQGQLYRAGGRPTSFAPSYRLVTDLGTSEARTSLAGGPSDRRFSRWYTSGIEDWLAGRFKTLTPTRPS